MRKVKYIIISVLSLLNIVLVPSFTIWQGFIPSYYENTFFGAMEDIFNSSDAFHYWSVIIILSVFIPSVLMLLTAFFNNKMLFSISSGLGVLLWLRIAISYIHQYDINEFFDFDDGSLSIGFWLAMILFIVAFIIGITSKKEYSSVQFANNKKFTVETNNVINQVVIEHGSFCPNCGNKIDKQSMYCGNCGYKF